MDNQIISARVVEGHRVASRLNRNRRFPVRWSPQLWMPNSQRSDRQY